MAIFEDDFESNDFSAWTDTATSTGETASVVTTDPHCGTYHADFDCDGSSGGETAYVYKTISSAATIYARGYFKIKTSLPQENGEYTLMQLVGTGWIAELKLRDVVGTKKWRLSYHSGASHLTSDYEPTPAIALDTYYCLELYTYVHATEGAYKVYIDGVERISVSGLDTDEHGDMDRVSVGETYSRFADIHGVFADCVVVDSSYIGPISGVSIPVAMHHYGHHISKIIRG